MPTYRNKKSFEGNELITSKEFISYLAKKYNISHYEEFSKRVHTLIKIMKEILLRDEILLIDGFGAFYHFESLPHGTRNISTWEPNRVISHRVTFRPQLDFLVQIKKNEKKRRRQAIKNHILREYLKAK